VFALGTTLETAGLPTGIPPACLMPQNGQQSALDINRRLLWKSFENHKVMHLKQVYWLDIIGRLLLRMLNELLHWRKGIIVMAAWV
jgi:hypothetical protein